MNFFLWKLRLKRAWKSWTVNYGLLLVIFGELQRQENYLSYYITDTKQFGAIMTVIGLLVVLLRFKTAKGLENK